MYVWDSIRSNACSIFAWIEPPLAITPLHCPSKITKHTEECHQLITQIAGYKYIRLYQPEEEPRIYPNKDPFMSGTSLVCYGILIY